MQIPVDDDPMRMWNVVKELHRERSGDDRCWKAIADELRKRFPGKYAGMDRKVLASRARHGSPDWGLMVDVLAVEGFRVVAVEEELLTPVTAEEAELLGMWSKMDEGDKAIVRGLLERLL